MSSDDQNRARRDAEVLLRQARTNLAAVRLKLQVSGHNFESAADMIRKALASPLLPPIELPDKLLSTSELQMSFQEWQEETNKIQRLEKELGEFRS
jgi:hypothetical protein